MIKKLSIISIVIFIFDQLIKFIVNANIGLNEEIIL